MNFAFLLSTHILQTAYVSVEKIESLLFMSTPRVTQIFIIIVISDIRLQHRYILLHSGSSNDSFFLEPPMLAGETKNLTELVRRSHHETEKIAR